MIYRNGIIDNRIYELTEENEKLREENRKLKEDNRFLTKISKEYMEKENIVEVAEFTELYKDDLEKENKKLKVENQELKNKYDDLKQLCEKIGEYNKNLMHEVNLCYRSLYK